MLVVSAFLVPKSSRHYLRINLTWQSHNQRGKKYFYKKINYQIHEIEDSITTVFVINGSAKRQCYSTPGIF